MLAKIANSTFAVDIGDSAANVSAAINTLNANGLIAAVTLTDAGTPTLSLNVAELAGDTALLSKITNAGYTVNIADTAAVIAASLDTLNNNAEIGAITLTDSGTPVLTLSAEQALTDTNVLGLITNANYTITVADTVANVLADATALAADARVSSITIVDNAAKVLAAATSLAADPQVTSVTVVDTAANVLAAAGALVGMPIATTVDVVNSAVDVAANFDALNADRSIARITLTDTNPVLTLTAEQAATDYSALFEISNPSYSIAVVDTAANVSAYSDQLAYNSNVASITLTDAGTPVLDLSSYSLEADSGALSKITNSNYTISLIGPVNVPVGTFLADQAILDAVPGGFAVSDLPSNVAASIDALNADPNVTAITLYGGYGGVGDAFVLSAAQAMNDTRALGEISDPGTSISVTNSAANILANSSALGADSLINSVVVEDTAVNVLANAMSINADSVITSITVGDTAANVLSSKSGLSALTKPVSVKVEDTAAGVSAEIDQLNSDASLSSMFLTDAGTPTLTLTAAQAIDDTNALDVISGAFAIAITDTAADVSQNLDALSQVSQITSITLTGTTHLALTLDAADALNDFDVLSTLTNASCDVTVLDTAVNIESNLDSLNADANVSSITVQGGGGSVITVTAATAAEDAVALSKLANATVDVVTTENISVAKFLSERSAIDSIGAQFSVLDAAANVSNSLGALDDDPNLSTITLSDSGSPTLTLTADQAVKNAIALDAITNPSYEIAITDTATAISNDFAGLSDVPQISAITLTDPGVPTLTLTAAQLADGAELFGEVTNAAYNVSVNDTAVNIANNFDSLNADAQVGSIVINDGGYMDLTVAQALDDSTALGKIANATYSIAVIDTAANIAANIDALSAVSQIAQIAPYDGNVTLTVAQAMENRSLLSKGSYSSATNIPTLLPVPVAIIDTAANVAAALDTLNRDAGIVSITLTDPGTPVLNLTAAQAANDTTALDEIVGPYTINIIQGGAAVSVADFLATQAALDATGDIVVSDSSENIAENFDALNADWHIKSLTSTDNAPLALTVARALGDAYALGAITATGYTIAVTDTAADVSSSFDAMNADAHVASITLTDAEMPTLTLTATQALFDRNALRELTNSNYSIAVVDTAANVVDNFGALNADANVSSITLLGSTTLALTTSEAIDDQAMLGEVTNSNYSITLVDTAADVSTDIDALNADTRVTSIFLIDQGTPTLTLTAAQALDDTTALGEISAPYAVAINDSSADVAAQLDALNSDGHVASITLSDSGVPTLALTAVQVQDDATALAKITNAPYLLSVVGTGSEIVNVGQTLQVANFAYDATNADWQLSGYGLAETLANVAGVVDASGHRFLLVGGGSEYTTAQAAVAAASDGDTILLTPGSDAADVGTSGKAITVEDVSAVGSTSDNSPPLVTITSPAEAGNFGFSGGPTITGSVTPYGTAAVAGQAVTLTDNGTALGTATVQADGSFSLYVELPYEGANSLVASVTDSFGNTGTSAAVTDTLDNISPTVTITSAAETSDVATQTITGIVTSGGAATVAGPNVVLFDNGAFLGTATVQADGTFSTTVTLLDQGSNAIVASAADSYGNIGSSAPVVDILGSSAPTVTITSSPEASNNANQTIMGTVVPTGTASVTGELVTLTDNGATLGTATVHSDGTFSASVTLPSQGTNSIVATVTDSEGNVGSSVPVIDTLDAIAPTVAITSPAEASNVAAQTIAGTAASGGTAAVIGRTVILTDNGAALGTAIVQSDGTFAASVTLPNQGANSIVASVTDSYGNTGSSMAVVDTLTVTQVLTVGAGGEYTTIQAAVDAAQSGDTINVASGTYSENVEIDGKAITIDATDATLNGQIHVDGTLDGALLINGLSVDAAGQQYGILVSANSTDFAGSVLLDQRFHHQCGAKWFRIY